MDSNKLLIIDDKVENLKLMVSIFSEQIPEYRCYQCSDPTNALEIAKEVTPDLIITDWDMPQISGIELIDQFKANPLTQDIPIIMATGVMLTTDHLKIALDAGAIDYIRKPIDAIELIARTRASLLITNYYKQIVKQKDQELTESSLYMVKSSEFINNFEQKVESIRHTIDTNPQEAKQQLVLIKNDLRQRSKDESWQRFNLSFSKVHKDFERNLTAKYPNLTPNELKLSAFVRLGMPNKEIASILNLSVDSIKVSRSRLRKKLNIESGINLEVYLLGF